MTHTTSMKALLIGGTGTISLPITRRLLAEGWQVTLINRGNKNHLVPGAEIWQLDADDVPGIQAKLQGRSFDVVAQFIAYERGQIFRDAGLYQHHCRQYVFISTASAYQKPPRNVFYDEGSPLSNPYWAYSREKIRCERLLGELRDMENFPMTIVRPSHTYGLGSLPLAVHGGKGPWQVIKRILERKPVLIPGDGTSLWTVTWAEDFAKAFVGLLGNEHAIGEAVQITSDEALTWNQIYRQLAQALDRPFLPCYVPSGMLALAQRYDYSGALLGDKANCALFDNSKIKALVPGFVAQTRYDQGMRLSLQHLMDTPALQVLDPDFDSFCDQVLAIMQRAEDEIAQL